MENQCKVQWEKLKDMAGLGDVGKCNNIILKCVRELRCENVDWIQMAQIIFQ
jgi:hypothetical protein